MRQRLVHLFFFFQAEDGIRDKLVTGVQTCALPIFRQMHVSPVPRERFAFGLRSIKRETLSPPQPSPANNCSELHPKMRHDEVSSELPEIGRASCRERV